MDSCFYDLACLDVLMHKNTEEYDDEGQASDIDATEQISKNEAVVNCEHCLGLPGVVLISVLGSKYCALLDSGASINLINSKVLRYQPNIVIDTTGMTAITGIATEVSPVLGAVRVDISLGDIESSTI